MRISVKNALLIGAFACVAPGAVSVRAVRTRTACARGRESGRGFSGGRIVGCALAIVPLTSRSGDVNALQALLFWRGGRAGRRALPGFGAGRGAKAVRGHGQVLLVGSGPHAAELYRQVVSDPHQIDSVIGLWTRRRSAPLEGTGSRTWGGIGTSSRC